MATPEPPLGHNEATPRGDAAGREGGRYRPAGSTVRASSRSKQPALRRGRATSPAESVSEAPEAGQSGTPQGGPDRPSPGATAGIDEASTPTCAGDGVAPAASTGRGSAAPPQPKDQQTRLLALTRDFTLFHDPSGTAYAALQRKGHVETWSLQDGAVRDILTERFYRESRRGPDKRSLDSTIDTLTARAKVDGDERPVFRRVGEHEGATYLDLGDQDWRVVRIAPDGWTVCDRSPIHFVRADGMRPLPVPERGGTLEELREVLRFDEDAWRLVVAYVTMALNPRGPYPILILRGSAGSGKSTTARVLRALVDPNLGDLNTLPREERDLMIAASNSWLPVFDNVSFLRPWLSDALCRLATGGALRTRRLYTDRSETIFREQRPIILNGIGDFVTREDVLSRALTLDVPPIFQGARWTEEAFWDRFKAAHPRLLGAVLDAVAGARRERPGVRLEDPPRMADFAHWGVAVERALQWPEGSFMRAYNGLLDAGAQALVESAPFAAAILELARGATDGWSGTAKDLWTLLRGATDFFERPRRGMPESARGVTSALQRYEGALRRAGVHIERPPRGRARLMVLRYEEPGAAPPRLQSAAPTSVADCGEETRSPHAHPPAPSGPASRRADAAACEGPRSTSGRGSQEGPADAQEGSADEQEGVAGERRR